MSAIDEEHAMRFPQGWELIVLLLVILVLFGSKKLPDAARGLGRSLRIFKSEVSELRDDKGEKTTAEQTAPLPPATEQGPAASPANQADERPAEAPPRSEG
jgi:sec-independent protein translocase protein TatA